MRRAVATLAIAAFAPAAHGQAAPWPDRLGGDLGVSVGRTSSLAPGARARTWALPYAYADFGRLFVREDTFGVRLVPVAWGAIELAGRLSTEGEDSAGAGVSRRSNPRPVGLGTFQETPWGGVFADAFVDTVSGGTRLEASYAAELDAGPLALYPQAGVSRLDARYARHLYGVGTAEASATRTRAYAPGAALAPMAALSAEWVLAPHWVLVGHAQREWFGRAITDSPRVGARAQTTAFLALARRF
jgi:outer membrane protein